MLTLHVMVLKRLHAATILAVAGLSLLAAHAETVPVTCGSVVKVQHTSTGHLLHSHDITYGSGSGQQSVTGFPGGDDANSYWIVRGPEHERCAQGKPVKVGARIRLQHAVTRRWLHSHHFTSPLSGNQEVSAFGDNTSTDTGDVWTVHAYKKATHWERDADVELRHEDTSVLLASGSRKYGRPISGQQEVCGKKKQGTDTWWRASEGVYFPAREADT